ncbi:hypothetical protein QJS04_geneDACA010810 [Acorus gramineus]|uniref:Brix domain-containing protein n=1 Tax=Acorus gramineus TaxID=55184 RepID=A0AAV9BCH3_ACOGR|nr:hypothetical protein QJS04_geneDACA010810 [Acorus gramineus]
MGGKRDRSDGGGERETEDVVVVEKRKRQNPSQIKNKDKRSEVYAKFKRDKKIEKRKRTKARDAEAKRALELGEEPPAKKIPRTIENTRESDETVCKPDDEELFAANDSDEFAPILKQECTPKILITTCRFHSTIVEYANKNDFTSLIVVHTNRREPDALLIIGLPNGPTAHFKLSKLVLHKDVKNHGNPTSHMPELVLNNFTTRLGHRIGRYIFEDKEEKVDSKNKEAKGSKGEKVTQKKVIARLQECGPRFTLKLISLQNGTFDTKGGEYEWVHKPEMDTSRRRFFL